MTQRSALRRRIAPSVPFALCATDNSGKEEKLELQLCLDADALCALEEKVPELNTLSFGGLEIFGRMNARVLGAALWAAVLRHHPEYDTRDAAGRPTEEGIKAIRSFVDLRNSNEVVSALENAYMATLSEEQKEQIRKLREKNSEDPTKAEGTSGSAGESSGPSADTTSGSATAQQAA